MTQSAAEQPASPLMTFILTALAAMMAPTLNDLALARLAAREAIDAYQARGQHELMTIGQIVAFAVTALDTLRLSMPDDLPLPMKLRLRGNANGLNRASRDCTRSLEKAQISPTPKPPPEAKTPQPLPELDWAEAMQSMAATLQDATTASPEERETDALWIEALNNVSGELRQAKPQTTLRSNLMATLAPPPHLFRDGKRTPV